MRKASLVDGDVDDKAGVSDEDELANLLQKDDAQLAPAIKVVFDRGLQDKFEETLSKHVRKKNAEIKSICNSHYQEFIGSIDNLVTVKNDITRLREMIVELNQNVQDSGQEVLNQVEELMEYQSIKDNINRSIDVIERCQYVINLLNKAAQHIRMKKYFSALKTLDQLQRHHLREFSSVEFSSHFEEQIPKMLVTIKNNVTAEFDTWLKDTQTRSHQLGALAIVQADEQIRAEGRKEDRRRKWRMRNKDAHDAKDNSEELVMKNADTFNEEELFEQVRIDLAPVHQALHIYENIGIPDKFVKHYTEQRQTHASQAVDLPTLGRAEFMKAIPQYFANIAGFFIIEDSVLKSGNNLMTRTEVESLWEMALSRMKVSLLEQMAYVQEPDHLLQLKNQVVLFARTMESYGFNTGPLISFLVSHRDKYEELLNVRLSAEMDKILEQEKFEPLTIENRDDFKKFVLAFDLHECADFSDAHPDQEAIVFPIGMPFSSTVPLVCRAVKHFIGDYYMFARYLPDMHAPIKKALDRLLCSVVDAGLNSMLDNAPSLNVSQAVQVSLNANYLNHACSFWERYTLMFTDPRYQKPLTLHARTRFDHTRVRGEDAIFEVIDAKIDQMMYGLAGNINWTPTSPQDGPGDYITMLTIYLETTLTCVANMPKAVRLAVHFTSCKHIVKILLVFLMEANRFNMVGIYNLDLDVRHLEAYAQRCGIHNLVESFAELRQIINLFMSGNLEQVLDLSIRETRFPLLSTDALLRLFDNFKELGLLSATPPEIPRIKKKYVDTIARQLRASSF